MKRFALLLLLLAPATAEAKPVRGPYLQMVTPSSAMVVWRTASSGDASLRWGTSLDSLDATLASTSTTNQHEIAIDGLMPNTKYYYAVEGTEPSEAYHFVTAPEPGSAHPFKMWVVGDSGVATAKQARVRDAMLRENAGVPPDVYLHVGDMAYSDGTDEEFQERYFEMYQNVIENTVAFPAIGNHENGASNSLTASGPYYDAYVLPTAGEVGGVPSGTEAYYSWDWANVHFIVLESYKEEFREVGSAMIEWLEMDLAATDQRWLVVYFHHPPYTKGSHDSDTEISHIEIRERVMPIFDAAGVDLVLGGHSHTYERSWLVYGAYDTPTTKSDHIVDEGDGRENRPYEKLGNGVQDGSICIVAGHGGTNTGRDGDVDHPLMLVTEVINGSVIVAVDGDVMRLKNVRFNGVVSDEFSITKGHALHLRRPEPGAELVKGSTTAIEWVSSGAIESVLLEYSTNGDDWTEIATTPAAPGRYVWTVPEGAEVFVRASDAGDSGARDRVDGTVKIIDVAPVKVFDFQSQWRYFAESLDGEDWTSPEFRDTPWSRGKGAFGVCACLPWECACNSYVFEALLTPTLYLRKRFELPEGDFGALELSLVHEVGTKIFINGTEVYGKHIDDESFEALADPAGIAAHIGRVRVDLDENPVLVPGTNTVAVLVKKNETLGPSLYFDMSMYAVPRASAEEDEGCGCTATERTQSGWLWLLVPLSVWSRRTSRRSCRSRSASRRRR